MRTLAIAACLSAALAAAPAFAQEEQVTAGPPDNVPAADTVYDDTWLSIGAGIGYGPSYDGSDDYVAYPTPLIQGRVAGIGIQPRPAGIAFDFFKDPPSGVGLNFGPVAKVRGFEHGSELLFGHVRRRVRAGLLTPTVCVSYGGDLGELDALPGYAALRETCAEHGVELFESPMSVTGMINVGTGAVTVGFASEDYEFSIEP